MNITRGNQYLIIYVLIIYIIKYSAHLATLHTHTHTQTQSLAMHHLLPPRSVPVAGQVLWQGECRQRQDRGGSGAGRPARLSVTYT